MRIKKSIVIVAVMLGCGAAGLGAFYLAGNNDKEQKKPEVTSELQQLIEHNGLLDSAFSISGDIRIMDSEDNNRVKEHSNFWFVKNGMQYYSQLSSQETISDGVLAIQIDSVSKYMAISRADTGVAESMKHVLPISKQIIDTANIKANVVVKGANREIVYTSVLTPEIKSARVVYDPATYKLLSAEIEWWKHPEMSGATGLWVAHISYNISTSKQLDINAKMKSILVFKNEQLVIAERFKTYKIDNMVSKN